MTTPDRAHDAKPSASTWLPAIVAVAVGAALVFLSGFLVWFRVLGVDLTGYRVANLITDYAGVVEGIPPRFLGVIWYLLPMAGAMTWIVLFARPPVAVYRIHVFIGVLLTGTVGVYVVVALDRSELTAGPVVALLGSLLIAVGAMTGIRHNP